VTSGPPQETPPTQRNPEGAFPTGPEVGAPVPDFTLPDQHGRPVHFASAHRGRRALLLFHRSVRW
jgi:hypothetical protein